MGVSIHESYNVTTKQFLKLESQMTKQQIQMATGKEFVDPSDDPIKLNQKTLVTNSTVQIEQYQANINDANAFIKTVEATLGSTIDALQRAREVGLMASNDTYKRNKVLDFLLECFQIFFVVSVIRRH